VAPQRWATRAAARTGAALPVSAAVAKKSGVWPKAPATTPKPRTATEVAPDVAGTSFQEEGLDVGERHAQRDGADGDDEEHVR
jgi:hypothetical protein